MPARAARSTHNATQTVFGEGKATARIMFVGEQPGDKEDLAGLPFVGPAGALFDEALAAAGFDRAEAYVTNAVKHFKFDAARQDAAAQDAGHAGNLGLPLVARQGTGDGARAARRRDGRDGGVRADRQAPDAEGPARAARRRSAKGGGSSPPSTRPTSCAFPIPPASRAERARFFAEIAEAAQLSREAA